MTDTTEQSADADLVARLRKNRAAAPPPVRETNATRDAADSHLSIYMSPAVKRDASEAVDNVYFDNRGAYKKWQIWAAIIRVGLDHPGDFKDALDAVAAESEGEPRG